MIVNIPIEPISWRYSEDWQKYFERLFYSANLDFVTIHGEEITKGIEQGAFLDCIGTNHYKSSQLMTIMKLFHNRTITNGDIFFFHDLWFPGIEQIRYTAQALGLDIKICGCLHAGTYDKFDFLAQKGMVNWGQHFENMLFEVVDKVFVATEYHKRLINSYRLTLDKVIVTGFPLAFFSKNIFSKKKENLIVFPHRLDPEKHPELFDKYAKSLSIPGWKWIKTAETAKTKDEYYDILCKAKIALSFADQETWGIAMQEATLCGCIPLVPNKRSYPEIFKNKYIYDHTSVPNLVHKLINFMVKYENPTDQQHIIELREKAAKTNIVNQLRGLSKE